MGVWGGGGGGEVVCGGGGRWSLWCKSKELDIKITSIAFLGLQIDIYLGKCLSISFLMP